jgi:MipA family protein
MLPLPYLVYRGARLKVDRSGSRGILFENQRLQLDLSLNTSVPMEINDNDARQGVPDIDPTVEVGSVLKYHWVGGSNPFRVACRNSNLPTY